MYKLKCATAHDRVQLRMTVEVGFTGCYSSSASFSFSSTSLRMTVEKCATAHDSRGWNYWMLLLFSFLSFSSTSSPSFLVW